MGNAPSDLKVSLTLTANPDALVSGMRTGQEAFSTAMRVMVEAAQKNRAAITDSLNNIPIFQEATKNVEAFKAVLGPAKTEAERLGNAFGKVKEDLAGVAKQLDQAQAAGFWFNFEISFPRKRE